MIVGIFYKDLTRPRKRYYYLSTYLHRNIALIKDPS